MTELHVFGPIAHGADRSMVRADLELYGINHFRPSYVGLVFFNDLEADADNASEDRASYAGRFAIFGHQSCSGDEGHCDVHEHLRRFDDRPSHPLTRAFKRVIVTDALRRCLDEELTISIVVSSDPKAAMEFEGPLLDLQGMQISTFV